MKPARDAENADLEAELSVLESDRDALQDRVRELENQVEVNRKYMEQSDGGAIAWETAANDRARERDEALVERDRLGQELAQCRKYSDASSCAAVLEKYEVDRMAKRLARIYGQLANSIPKPRFKRGEFIFFCDCTNDCDAGTVDEPFLDENGNWAYRMVSTVKGGGYCLEVDAARTAERRDQIREIPHEMRAKEATAAYDAEQEANRGE